MSQTPDTSSGRKLVRMRNVVFLSIGIALIVLSAWTKVLGLNTLSAIALDLGLVSVAVLLVDQIWRICGGDPIAHQIAELSVQVERLGKSIDTIENREHIGLSDAFASLAEFGIQSDWVRLLENAEDRVDVMGRTCFGWSQAKNLSEILTRKIRDEGVTFRWLLMSKENEFLPMLEVVEPHSMLSSKIEAMQSILRDCWTSLPEACRQKLQVRCFRHVPLTCSILRIDGTLFITQYLFSATSTNCPFYTLEGAKAAWPSVYSQEFETIWEGSEDLLGAPETRASCS